MTRAELQYLTRQRIKEAKLLLDNNLFSGSYYLSGYALEFALKSCITKNINKHTIPEKNFLRDFYNHDLSILLKTAGLENAKNLEARRNTNFEINWTIVLSWSESSRYKTYTQAEAAQLYSAITQTQKKGGVLKWIQHYW